MKKLWCICLFLFIMMSYTFGFAESEEESSFSFPTKEETKQSVALSNTLQILAPEINQTYPKGGVLPVQVEGENFDKISVTLLYKNETATFETEENAFTHIFDTPMFWDTGIVRVTGEFIDESGQKQTVTQEVTVLAPKDKLILDMFALAKKNSKEAHYRHAPAQTDSDRGGCKNFVMRMFDTFKEDYRMKEYPDLPLHMPKNKSKKDSAPYQYGIEWRDESAEDGSPFVIAAQYKYDKSLSHEENMENCRQVLHSVQSGDFFQMTGDYYHGNGPHSLLFMTDYDEKTDNLYFTDSNMLGDRVDGARWGYMQYEAERTGEWFVEAISNKSTYKTRGCTLYRLRDDLFVK